MYGQGKTGLISGVRTITTSRRTCAKSNHYDVLGVTPKSSQGDIKSAYYKLSKVYHPDKSADEASARKFRAITEAYEVLGNVKLKKMYDKGLLVGGKTVSKMTPEEEPKDPTLRFYKSRATRNIIPTIDGKVPVYNFDEWAKNHYNNLYEKSQYEKDFLRKRQEIRADAVASYRQETIVILILVTGVILAVFVMDATVDYDQDHISKQTSNVQANNVEE